MKISEFDYQLPPELIAQQPAEPRDSSRLMVVHRREGRWEHRIFHQISEVCRPDDLFVLNDTRVFPARLEGQKATGGRVELLLLRPVEPNVWEVLARPSRRLRAGERLRFSESSFQAQVVDSGPGSRRRVAFRFPSGSFEEWLERLGKMPLPPYIKRKGRHLEHIDRERYQTVFAAKTGSVAAPTAGLHFTPRLLEQLNTCRITLHVGVGTFLPVRTERVENHHMESEYYEVSKEAAETIEQHRRAGGRVIAVGTTVTRVLEHLAREYGEIRAGSGWTDLFIYPGFQFQVVEGLLTNFHLPRSTPILLVSAFCGWDLLQRCYREAVERRYRFYSYGDAMLIV